ncbi:MAG: imidazolonepropionase [Planctomycetota bacterium]|nr:MAG: imidazolonepropionase [Planctomycetota bacterium]
MNPTSCDLLVLGARQVLTLDSGEPMPPAASRLQDCRVVEGGGLAVQDGKILALGMDAELEAGFSAKEVLRLQGGVVVPGFVDAHTHPAFAVGRAEEFDWRAQGMGYVEIAEKGGGILSSVRAVRAVSEPTLGATVAGHFRRMLAHGTTTCEAKSGYGLSTESELKSLRAIEAAAKETGMQVRSTFLGGHMVPEEYRDRPDAYVDLLCQESLPAVAEAGLATAADVYIEGHAFDLKRSRRYLERAKELGFRLRVHAEQFENLGGAAMAVSLGADCADHLEALDPAGIQAMAESGKTFAGLLPAVPHFLRQNVDAPARALLEADVPYFVATDFNPGTCFCLSIPEALHFARVRLRFSALEALAGATVYAAHSLGLGTRKGRLAPGWDADFLVLDLPDYHHLGYAFGENPVAQVFVGGKATLV